MADPRPPAQDGEVSLMARVVLGLREYGPPGRQAELKQRIERARGWLSNLTPRFNEERVFQLLGLMWAGGDSELIRRLAKELQAEQRPDGGWSQNAYLKSDAYATGQSLYALNQAAGLETSDKPYRRGLAYLLDSQLADGSWHVKSRTLKLQPYFQGGFPHDQDQCISSSATAWAAAAMALGCPTPAKDVPEIGL